MCVAWVLNVHGWFNVSDSSSSNTTLPPSAERNGLVDNYCTGGKDSVGAGAAECKAS